MARPVFKPLSKQRELVELCISYGAKQEDVAGALGIDPKTLRKAFSAEIARAMMVQNAKIMKSSMVLCEGRPAEYNRQGKVIREELKPSAPMAIFLLKSRLGFSEYGPMQRPVAANEPKPEKLGKKAAADLASQHPEAGTTMGDLMLRRQAGSGKPN